MIYTLYQLEINIELHNSIEVFNLIILNLYFAGNV